MARSSEPLSDDEIWGTWEELLLACAVNRHGPHSWDSVAGEVRSRSPYAQLLTADNCRQRYRLLKRRFCAAASGEEDVDCADGRDEDGATAEIPWLEELRKLRMAELRREVQRYDVSIGSLQLKVKRLKEERERSLRGDVAEEGCAAAANGSGSGSGSAPAPDSKEKKENQEERPSSPPENPVVDGISGEASGRSCKESNSTEAHPKLEAEAVKVKERIKQEKADPAVNGSRSGTGLDPAARAEASYNGSSDTIAKGTARSPAADPGPAVNESGESVAESKGREEEEGTKESSDVQSSASLSRRQRFGRRRRGVGRGGGSGGGISSAAETGAEAVSPVRKAPNAEYQPLIAFLDSIRSTKDAVVLDRRLVGQESVRYRGLIRRHVDLEMVRERIGRKGYTQAEFFRDLLLFCNNALVFHPKNSPESISAVHLRDLVNKEIASTLRRSSQTSQQSAKEPTPPPPPPSKTKSSDPPSPQATPPPPASKTKSDADRAAASSEKPAPLPPLAACRKRSSVSAKPAPGKPAKKAAVKEEKTEKEKLEKEERAEGEEEEEEEEEKEKEKGKEKAVDKKSKKQRTAAVASRGLRTSKTRSGNRGGASGVGSAKNQNSVPATKSETAEKEPKSDAGAGGSTVKKRAGVAGFLNRMKSSNSPTSANGKVQDAAKAASGSGKGGGGGELKKKTREDSRKENAAVAAAAGKRSVGRPPKRAAAMPAPPAKRAREEKTPPMPKKRGRR